MSILIWFSWNYHKIIIAACLLPPRNPWYAIISIWINCNHNNLCWNLQPWWNIIPIVAFHIAVMVNLAFSPVQLNTFLTHYSIRAYTKSFRFSPLFCRQKNVYEYNQTNVYNFILYCKLVALIIATIACGFEFHAPDFLRKKLLAILLINKWLNWKVFL